MSNICIELFAQFFLEMEIERANINLLGHIAHPIPVLSVSQLSSLKHFERAPYAKLVTPFASLAPRLACRVAAAEQICRRPSEREIHS